MLISVHVQSLDQPLRTIQSLEYVSILRLIVRKWSDWLPVVTNQSHNEQTIWNSRWKLCEEISGLKTRSIPPEEYHSNIVKNKYLKWEDDRHSLFELYSCNFSSNDTSIDRMAMRNKYLAKFSLKFVMRRKKRAIENISSAHLNSPKVLIVTDRSVHHFYNYIHHIEIFDCNGNEILTWFPMPHLLVFQYKLLDVHFLLSNRHLSNQWSQYQWWYSSVDLAEIFSNEIPLLYL